MSGKSPLPPKPPIALAGKQSTEPLCPIMTAGILASGKDLNVRCETIQCSLWDADSGCCCILTIATAKKGGNNGKT